LAQSSGMEDLILWVPIHKYSRASHRQARNPISPGSRETKVL
jgi:hypothetical protein